MTIMCASNSNGYCYCRVVGFGFRPSDEEILSYYLQNKMIGNDDRTRAIAEVQLCQWEPWDLPGQSAIPSNNHMWYFFCRRDNKSPKSKRFQRKTKEGFWKVTGNDRTIRARDTNKVIGTKKTLVFHKGPASNAVGTNWVIHEYSPPSDTIPPNSRDFVVCRLEEKPVEKNSPSATGECGSSLASTSNNGAANNALPEQGQNPSYMDTDEMDKFVESFLVDDVDFIEENETNHLELHTGPRVGNNEIDYQLALQASMEEQGLSVAELSDPNFHGYDGNWIQEQDPCYMDTEETDEFVKSFLVDDIDFIEENVSTHQHGYRPSSPHTTFYMDDCGETETVMDSVQGQLYNSEGSWQNPSENDIDYKGILISDTSSNNSAAGTSSQRNFQEFAEKDTSITTRTFKSQYQPRSTSLAEKAPRNIQLKRGFSSKDVVSKDKSKKDHEVDREKKTKEDLSRRSSESAGSNRRGSSFFKEMPQSTSFTPSPPLVYLFKVILGVILFIIIAIDAVGLH